MKQYNTFFTDDEEELFNILIFSGVEHYLSEIDKSCKKNNDIKLFISALNELEELLSKLDFDVKINIKEIEIL